MIAKSVPPFSFVTVNLADAKEYTEIQRQRTICGWAFSDETLAFYREKQDQKLKSLFWITISNPDASASTTTAAESSLRAGHISLDAYVDPPNDPDLVAADKSSLAFQTFFILPEYRKLGLGDAAMTRLETMARAEPYGSPNCRFLTLSTLCKKYVCEEGPEWRGLWARFGLDVPAFSAHEWYEKRGYVLFKEEPRYPVTSGDGVTVKLVLVCMRKSLV